MKDELELLHDRYARALYACAEEDGTVEKVMTELFELNQKWINNKEFNIFLSHRLICPEEKKAVVEKLLRGKRCCKAIINFLRFLIDNRRETLIHGVFLRYRDLYEESMDTIRMYVETARDLTKGEKGLLADILKEKFSFRKYPKRKIEIEAEIKINPDLIGGLFVKYKDRIYDNSTVSHLRNLKRGFVR